MSLATKKYKLPAEPLIPGFWAMVKKDCKAVHELINEYLSANFEFY